MHSQSNIYSSVPPVLFYDEVKHQQLFGYNLLIVRYSYIVGTSSSEQFKNNLRLNLKN